MRICPNCNRVFYILNEQHSVICTHCSYDLLDKRFSKREKIDIDFSFSLYNKTISAKITDYSDNGVRIVYNGEAVPVNTIINLNIKELKIELNAIIVWSDKKVSLNNVSGLKLLYL